MLFKFLKFKFEVEDPRLMFLFLSSLSIENFFRIMAKSMIVNDGMRSIWFMKWSLQTF